MDYFVMCFQCTEELLIDKNVVIYYYTIIPLSDIRNAIACACS